MSHQVVQIAGVKRAQLGSKGRKPAYFTIAYNSLEGVVAVLTGLIAGSIARGGFGFDSMIQDIYSGSRRKFSGMRGNLLTSEGALQREEQGVSLLVGRPEIASDTAELAVPGLRLIRSSTR